MNDSNLSLNKILSVLLVAIFSFILIVTIVGLASKKARPGKNLRKIDPLPEEVSNTRSKNGAPLSSFSGLGSIRAMTKPNEKDVNDIGVPLVIEPWFSYPEGDNAFYEELAKKSSILKGIIVNYFSLYSYTELRKKGEDVVKEELFTLINEHLVLGKIHALYFSEYIFFE
ncbi:MAG: hypothetical protein IKI31_01205 [Treponema sp.]|nr:hypothetical protein [Treponema sp.]